MPRFHQSFSQDDLNAQMQKVAKGDALAFRHLAQNLAPKLYLLAQKLLSGDRAMAEDILQETLITLWQTAPRWQPRGSVSAFASRILYNKAIDHHRRKKMTTEIPDDLASAGDPQQDMMRKEQQNDLLAALKKLPERQRQALLLFYYQGYSQKETAALMGTTAKAAESILARARDNMKKILPQGAISAANHLSQKGARHD